MSREKYITLGAKLGGVLMLVNLILISPVGEELKPPEIVMFPVEGSNVQDIVASMFYEVKEDSLTVYYTLDTAVHATVACE